MAVVINGTNTPTAGGVTYGDGTQYATTAAGTSGQVLTSAGSSAPTWSTPSSGAMTLISTIQNTSSVSTLSFTSIPAYRYYRIVFQGLQISTAAQIYLQISQGGTFQTSSYYYNGLYVLRLGSVTSGYTTSASGISLSSGLSVNFQVSGVIDVTGGVGPQNATANYACQIRDSTNNYFGFATGNGFYPGGTQIDGLQLTLSAGVFTTSGGTPYATVSLYGISS